MALAFKGKFYNFDLAIITDFSAKHVCITYLIGKTAPLGSHRNARHYPLPSYMYHTVARFSILVKMRINFLLK